MEIKTSTDFDNDQSNKSKIFSGLYDLGAINSGHAYVMDYPFEKYIFKNCIILGGSFSCSNFDQCIFENVLISDSDLSIVTFSNCEFKKCIFNNIIFDDEIGFSFKDCKFQNLKIKSMANLTSKQAIAMFEKLIKD